MGSIRTMLRKNGNYRYHAEVRLSGYSAQRASFDSYKEALEWIETIETAIKSRRKSVLFKRKLFKILLCKS